ncbi:hypothetical protein DFH11DRAFT_245183 [Phellopilus nigrolimitatus]|nr:hypothetical protein DFH11DRAFT_245183 [Phellopilus nigrolimitatus]
MLHNPLSPATIIHHLPTAPLSSTTPTSSHIPLTVCFCADVFGGSSPVSGPSRQGPSAPPMFAPRPPVFSPPSPPPINTSCAQSQPLEHVPTELVDTQVPEKLQQPTPEELLCNYGIRVRDFAFEASALSPVPAVRRAPVRELKRVREETEEEREWRLRNEARRFELSNARVRQLPNISVNVNVNDNASASASAGTSAVSRQDLQRKRTELVIPPSVHSRWYGKDHSGASLSRVLAPLQQLSPKRQHVQHQSSQHFPLYSQSQSQSQLQLELAGSSQPPLLSALQADSEMDDEEYVKTPLVTPNGSLVYSDPLVDASMLPESQVAPLLAAS